MNIIIRKATCQDTENYIALLHQIKDGMKQSDWFFVDSDDWIRGWVNSGSMQIWLAEDGTRLAGAFSIVCPGFDPDNLGYDLGFTQEQLLRVVHMDSAVVHPDYRGLGLQKRLMAEAEKEIRKQPHRILLTTVHPENQYSLQNILKQDYTVVKEYKKYGSFRCILRKDLP